MGGPPGSQAAPLPTNLPFRLVSKTIGCGAYASIRKAVPLGRSNPVIAVKFINKAHAFRAGRLRPKQLQLELSLHASVCPHDNVIRFLSSGTDDQWIWLCLELAEGGDLFDKIEADEGVGEDVAHFYFTQLVSAVSWCHGKGVAHRDIKPENMLLSGDGDLKLADFGLATQYLAIKTGERKVCGMVCGSPPYIAPEILEVGTKNQKRKQGEEKLGYDPAASDVWSCAIVLFVLLAGNTPWDAPIKEESYEFMEYLKSNGRPSDELWETVPTEVLSLIRGMLKVDVPTRFGFDDVRRHPWFTRRNPQLNEQGKAANPVGLATQMLESLHIDFTAPLPQSQPPAAESNPDQYNGLAATQPDAPITPISDAEAMDWEKPPRLGSNSQTGAPPAQNNNNTISASQPMTNSDRNRANLVHDILMSHLAEDPSMSQFAPTPSVPLTLTQVARKFQDIVPAHSLARFLSTLAMPQFLPLLSAALHRLNIPQPAHSAAALAGQEEVVTVRVKTSDARKQPLNGSIVVERMPVPGQSGMYVLEVRFAKAKGDPVGWRRLFKQVAILCKEGLVMPGQ